MKLDHLAVAAETLEAGVAWLETALGVLVGPGGRHARMGTWNRLLSLGGEEYLEVLAVDPAAPAPGRARWFGLDEFAGPPRLVAWVVACDDLAARALPGAGPVLAFERGSYRWQMAVPEDGRLGFDGLQPGQIEWQGPHPGTALEDRGCRLQRLVLRHPQADALAGMLGAMDDPRLVFETGPTLLRAEIRTPGGLRLLG